MSPRAVGPGLQLNRTHQLDALAGLRLLNDNSIDCVMTSPPYWRTRDYGVPPTSWADGQSVALGLEAQPEDFIAHLCEVFDEVKRVLKPSGTCWINIGDSYAGGWHSYSYRENLGRAVEFPRYRSHSKAAKDARWHHPLPEKSLCLIPERFALAMSANGWIVRNRIVWQKSNPIPSSVKDRLSQTWEPVLLFVKSKRYYFDLDAIRIPLTYFKPPRIPRLIRPSRSPTGRRMPPNSDELGGRHPLGKNPGDVWTIATRRSPTGHSAAYPEALCEIPVKAGCPSGGVVLDPFMGSRTTARVAERLGRRWIGFDLAVGTAESAERLSNLKL